MAKIKIKKIKIANGKEEVFTEDIGLMAQIEKMKRSGETNSVEFREKNRELEVLLGINTINPFGTNELDIFEDNLKEMNYADMKKLAERVGVNFNHDRSTLKSILIKEFKAVNRNNRRNIMPNQINSVILDPNDPIQAAALKILGEF